MVFTLVVSCLLAMVAALACVVVVLTKAVRRAHVPAVYPQVPTLTVAAGPGWYDQRDGSKRYWDGSRWTEIIRGAPPAPAPSDD